MRKIFLIIYSAIALNTYAQDPVFTQNLMMPETISTSFTGSAETLKLGAIYRNQWRGLAFKTNTTFAFVDGYIDKFKSGIGISILHQRENATKYQFTQINANYALKIRLNDEWYFRPSISVGWGIKDYAFNNVILEDQIDITSGFIDPNTIDPILIEERRNFFDFSSSILFNNETSWIGFTIKHLNKPNIALTQGGNTPLEMFFSVHGSMEFDIFKYNNNKDDHSVFALANYMHQGQYGRLDIGAQYVFNGQFSTGVTMTTNPVKPDDQSPVLTSINPFIGLRWKEFKFGLSYDINTTDIGNTGGVFEFLLSYELDNFVNEGLLKCRPSYF